MTREWMIFHNYFFFIYSMFTGTGAGHTEPGAEVSTAGNATGKHNYYGYT